MPLRSLFLSICLVILASLVSCKKDPIQYTFEGTITESVNQAGLSGVSVDITQKTYDGSVASVFFNPAGNAITDVSGNFEISFDREKVVEFKIELIKSGYFDVEMILNSSEVTTDEPKVIDYAMEPQSWVTFHIKNIPAAVTGDEFRMIHYNFREGCEGCTTNDFYYYYGIVDSTFTYATTGGEYARYSYKTPAGSIYIQDSVYTTLFDTAFVNINY